MISNALRIAAGMLLLSCFGCTSANRAASIEMKWDPRHTQQPLAISNDGLTLSWERDSDSNWRLCRLPRGSTVIPAGCLLRKGQIVTLSRLRRIE